MEVKWKDLTQESYRVYAFSDGSKYKVDNPVGLCVRDSGAHMVLDTEGLVHYIPSNYIAFAWKPANPSDTVQF